MNAGQFKRLLKLYKNGLCTLEEKMELESWLDAISESGEWDWTEEEKLLSKQRLKEKVDDEIQRKEGGNNSRRWVGMAASVFLFVSVGFLFHNTKAVQNIIHTIKYTEVSAAPGEIKKIHLSDGSVVYLNGGSKVKYPLKFSHQKREFFLQTGEAYFDIAHKENEPFIVYAGKSQTQVFGTAFNVRFYSFLENIKITVARGKVAVMERNKNKISKPVFLNSNEQVVLDKKTGQLLETQVNYKDVIGWLDGKTQLNNETLKNAAGMIEMIFNVKIRFLDEHTKSIRLTGAFDRTDDLKEILFAICKANKLNYAFKNGDILIKPR
jgi:ferric-dicitrate binding protein FerR (iron transport regulator)